MFQQLTSVLLEATKDWGKRVFWKTEPEQVEKVEFCEEKLKLKYLRLQTKACIFIVLSKIYNENNVHFLE